MEEKKKWPVVPGDYCLGEGDYVAIAELGDSTMQIPTDLFAIKGRIYTPNLGVVRLVQNLISNPNLQYLVLTGSPVPGFLPGQALLSLSKKGINKNKIIIGAKGYKPVVRGLQEEEIKQFREKINIIDLRGKEETEVVERIKQLPTPTSEEVIPIKKRIPKKKIPQGMFENVQTIIGDFLARKTLSDMWTAVLRHIWLYGKTNPSQRGDVREVLSLITKVKEPKRDRAFSNYYMTREELEEYAQENILSPGGKKATYTYGNRLFNYGNLNAVLNYMQQHEYTRRGVIALWNPNTDVGRPSPPCFTHAQLFIRENTLHLVSYWRSHDMYGAAPANWYGLSRLMEYAAEKLKIQIGTLTTFSSSAHIYKSDWNKVREIIGEYPREIKVQKRVFNEDEKGYFLIEVNEKIMVEHRNKNNELLYRFSGTNAEAIGREIAHLSPGLNPQHFIYLGRELKKAEFSLTHEKEYRQDKPLHF